MALHGSRGLGLLLALTGLLAFAAPTTSAIGAEFGIVPGGFAVRMLDAEGNLEHRAGSHPDRLQVDFALEVAETGTTPRDFVFDLPPGFGGSPDAVLDCPRLTYEKGEECPPESQVGLVRFGTTGGQKLELPVYKLEPEPGQLVAIGAKSSFGVPFTMELSPADFAVTFAATNAQQVALSEGHIELWGVPADHQIGTAIPRRPFLTAPSRCGQMVFTFRTRSWEEGAPWLSASTDTGAPLSGCETLGFDPKLSFALSNPVADSPTGMRMDLSMAGEDDSDERSSAQVKDVTVALPEGLTVSPGGAAGRSACSDSQFGLGSSTDPQCPASSRVGRVEMSSPDLREPLVGTSYIGEEHPGERFRMLVAAPGSAATLKFAAALVMDPATGRLSAALRDLPQVPIERLSMEFDGGPGALLASPLACGPTAAEARFVPYGGGPPVNSLASVAVGAAIPGLQCPGPVPFAPGLTTASLTSAAGRPNEFSATLRRKDGEQLPSRFSMQLPSGLSPALGALQACPDADLAAATCPAESKVASVLAEVGSGPRTATLRGSGYLTGPYRGAPFGMLLAFRAALGPFDLGTISLRAAAQVSHRTGRVTVSTDRLPRAIEGMPVRFHTIELSMDRPGLIRNPTSCAPNNLAAQVEATSGAMANVESPFVVTGCDRLGLKPRIELELRGRRQLHRGGKPSLVVSTRTSRGETNLRALTMSLPDALEFNIAGLKAICSGRDAAAGLCGDDSQVGTVFARTPLLSKPLTGAIHVAQPSSGGQPDLWLSLRAKGVHFDIRSTASIQHGHAVTKLTGLPDMPLSTLTMRLGGGRDGLISLGRGLCEHGRSRRLISTITAKGQDGARRQLRVGVKADPRCSDTLGAPPER